MLATVLPGATRAKAIGLGPAGWYSFGSSDCNEDSRSDPIGALFRGKRASAHNVAGQVKIHLNWNYDVSKDQYLWVLLNGGGYGCREANESVAEFPDAPTPDHPNPFNSRYHVRLWFVPATNGSSELKTVGTPHHEDWVTYDPLNNHCKGVTGVGSHAVDKNGPEGSGFDQGRHKLKEGFENGGHKIESEWWGNTKEIEQCDEDWASSAGWGVNIGVNHAMEPYTRNASYSGATSSTLNGTLLTEEPTTEWWFGYGPYPSQGASGYPYKTAIRSTSATGEFNVSEGISGLASNTQYYVRMFARNPAGEVEEGGEVVLLGPEVETGPVVWFPAPHQAMASGRVNPNGSSTYYWWQYGTSSGYGSSTAAYGAGASSEWQWAEQPIMELRGNTLYHYSIVAESEYGRAVGENMTFTTPDWRPIVTPQAATEVKRESAVLHAKINPQGSSTHYHFEYGTTTDYGTSLPVPDDELGSDVNDLGISYTIHGLAKGTVYHFRAVAESEEGRTVGEDREFKTPDVPHITTEPPSYTNTFEPQLNATIDPERAETFYLFEYGTTTAYGSTIPPATDIGAGDVGVPAERTLKGLLRNTTYHYRVTAENEVGLVHSPDQTFTTLPSCKGTGEKCEWSTRSVPNPPLPNPEAEFKDVSCVSSTMCVAVGRNLSLKKSFVERWNGSAWTVIANPTGEINRVSCYAATACLAAGVSGAGAAQTWGIVEINGAWGAIELTTPLPNGAIETTLKGISCTSSSACTAVGSYKSESTYKPLVERWNGSAWSLQTAPGPAEGSAQNAMLSVSCVSSPVNACVAVGEAASRPVAEGWNGAEWTRLPTPPLPTGATGGKLLGVSCTATLCITVGNSYEAAMGSEKPLAESWNGSSWSRLTTPSPSEAKSYVNLTGVSCSSTYACTAAGYYASALSGGAPSETKTLAEFWNGSSWAIQSSANVSGAISNALAGISCTATNACTTVGLSSPEFLGRAPAPLAERWNGTSWVTQSVPFPQSPPIDDQLKSVSCVAPTCIGVGWEKSLKRSFLERWTGSEWKFIQNLPGEVNDVSCISPTACFAAGISAAGAAQTWSIFELNGAWGTMELITPPLPNGAIETTLKGISCTSSSACTAVGSYKSESTYKPLVERWNGSAWSLQTAPGPAEGSAQNAMLSVSCASFRAANTCMAVGEAASKPVAEIWDGSEWSRTPTPSLPTGATGAKLASVSCSSPASCVAVGDSYEATAGSEKALVERWYGPLFWTILSSPTPVEAKGLINLYDVSCLSPSVCFAAGSYATSISGGVPLATHTLAEAFDKEFWTIQASPNASGKPYNTLLGVSCTSQIACTAVGAAATGPTSPGTLLAERYE